jgi:formate hydrogenlyase transcriptional activator
MTRMFGFPRRMIVSGDVHTPETSSRRYAAVLRISEAISACSDPQELATILADRLIDFLSFDHLDVVIFKEKSTEIEWHAWGKGPLPLPDLPIEELPEWNVYNSQEPLHIRDWSKDERFSQLKKLGAALGVDAGSIGSVIRVPLTTPHRRLGVFGIASVPGVTYSTDDVSFLQVIARVVAFAIDDGLNLRRAQQQTERLQLLLNLTNRITSNLKFRDLLRAISANIREVMECDAAGISLPGEEAETFRIYALDFPGGKGLVNEELIVSPGPNDPGKRAFETLKPVIGTVADAPDPGWRYYELVIAEGIQNFCVIPLMNRGRALGTLALARVTESSFTPEDVEFLNQAAGQIAIAIANALAYGEISELKDKLAQEKVYLEEEIRSEMHFDQIVGSSPALKHALKLVETVAPSDSTVLLLGETGTGKELIARAIHDRSRRKDRTFVKLNCAAIPTGLLESELFGHEKGAFTGAIGQKVGRMELADQGTLFLDEVGDIPTEIQPKLLRVLQEREFERLGSTHTRKVNVRLIAATNRDLEKMIANREFRSDLFYRLNVFPIRIPPLRERKEDIPLLVSYFVQKFARQMQRKIETIPAAVMKGLTAWEWPGNIRELENFIERAVILTCGKALDAPLGELRKPRAEAPAQNEQPAQDHIARIVKETISALNGKKDFADEYAKKQREEIVGALTGSKGRVGGADGAAARIGINRTTLISRMKKFGIDPRQYA